MKVMNPVLPGFNPDPSLVRAGDDYYIATSTFEWFPGICIHHSKDLVNWEILSYALTDETKFDIEGMDTACGIWAPSLTYDKGTFYLIYTIVYTNRHRFKDTHNFMVTASDPKGPWSDPIPLNKMGFDPSLFHDPDGTKWLVNMLFDYRLDHKRFGGVGVQQYDPETKKLVGPVYNVFKGSDKGTTEGPNVFYHDGWYYLVTAEGGTEFKHCVTMCRSKKFTGPYEISPYVPVLTSFGKDVRLKRAGHGQIIQGKDGNWYMAHLCSRSLDEYSITGRETAIQNMTYTDDGWFKLSANDTASPEDFFEVPGEVEVKPEKSGFTDFGKITEIPLEYMTLRQSAKTCGISISNGKLHIQGGNSLASKYNQGLLVRRHQHHSYDFIAKMEFVPRDYCHMAGIVCYYNYDNNYYLHMSVDDEGKPYVMLNISVNKEIAQSEKVYLEENEKPVYLKAEVRERDVTFFVSQDGNSYTQVGDVLDMRNLSDERVDGNGFAGAMLGVSCQDLHGDGVQADFAWLDYKVFKPEN